MNACPAHRVAPHPLPTRHRDPVSAITRAAGSREAALSTRQFPPSIVPHGMWLHRRWRRRRISRTCGDDRGVGQDSAWSTTGARDGDLRRPHRHRQMTGARHHVSPIELVLEVAKPSSGNLQGASVCATGHAGLPHSDGRQSRQGPVEAGPDPLREYLARGVLEALDIV